MTKFPRIWRNLLIMGKSWNYVGTLLDDSIAKDFGATFFTGTSLASENGRVFLMVVPEIIDEGKELSYNHKGTLIYEFEDISKGELKKDSNGKPIVHKYLLPSVRMGGQSDYDEQNIHGGIIMFQTDTGVVKPGTDPSEYEIFKIFNTKEKIID